MFWTRAGFSLGLVFFHGVRAQRKPSVILLFSGWLDPVTPPRWAEEAGKYLTNSLHITVPGVAHGTLGAGCVPDLMEAFVQSASVDGLDSTCVDSIERPAFFDSPLGPGTRDTTPPVGGPSEAGGAP